MSSTSPGHVMLGQDAEDIQQATVKGARAPVQVAESPMRAKPQKRGRGSPASPAHTRALALLGSLTDTVRTGAVRGLRALTDTIERARDETSSSGSSVHDPPSPTDDIAATQTTPAGKRRRTTLTDARTRRTHANWRSGQWDYSSMMRGDVFHCIADGGPTTFSFPVLPTAPGGDTSTAMVLHDAAPRTETPAARPSSPMSAVSAPAAFSTPSARPDPDDAPRPADRARNPSPENRAVSAPQAVHISTAALQSPVQQLRASRPRLGSKEPRTLSNLD
ncbi:hypothetical protein AURDEDRAFT_177592 [Auricularia subglabra TFB-10046 SS5]|uniref:Uncharacterized protein n=1 Tax=Auricularia subglabra (strain TFB-10046 / SS5) TaxID=717982 RepID=J0CSR9_AURST|nr:hypothetical protein AURDEDRAFT_177592 [Auricularia subglabra TFB-10046 SS5]